ncbi:MAG: hypothetical protein ACI8TP_000154 [Acidimicrobiales bacterium]|jgi:hypothetical protein
MYSSLVRRFDSFLHPAFTGAVAVLAVNDHLLKAAWPGLVTGKLSDVAGVFVVAIVSSVLLNNRVAGLTLTIIGFGALKTAPAVAFAAAPLLGGVTRTDPTDLVALMMVVPSYFFLGRDVDCGPNRVEPTTGLRPAALVVVAAVTLVTTTATSCDSYQTGVEAIEQGPNALVAYTGGVRFTSDDGGRTWSPASAGESRIRTEHNVQHEACLRDGRCFRVVDNDRVEERADDQWVTAFRYTDEEVGRMRLRANSCDQLGSVEGMFSSVTVAELDGSEIVLVVMDRQGVLRLDPATSTWTRHGIGIFRPPSLWGPRWLRSLVYLPWSLLLFGPLLLLINRGRSVSLVRRGSAAAIAVVLGIGCGVAFFVLSVSTIDYAQLGLAATAMTVIIFVGSVLIVLPKGRPKPAPPPPRTPPPPARH